MSLGNILVQRLCHCEGEGLPHPSLKSNELWFGCFVSVFLVNYHQEWLTRFLNLLQTLGFFCLRFSNLVLLPLLIMFCTSSEFWNLLYRYLGFRFRHIDFEFYWELHASGINSGCSHVVETVISSLKKFLRQFSIGSVRVLGCVVFV